MSRSFFDSIRQYGKRLLKTKPRETARGCNRSRRARLEMLESRRLLTYTFAYNPGTQVATAIGTAAVDSLVLEPSGGLLLYSVNGGAFSGNWGGFVVPLTSTLAVNVNVSTGSGSSITLGTPTGPASTFGGGTLHVVALPNSADAVTIDDSAGTTLASGASAYSIDTFPGTISGPGFNYNEAGSTAFEGGITLEGSPVNGDIYNVLSVFNLEPVTISTASTTTSTVNVGSGGTLNVKAPLAIIGTGAATTLNINDASDTTDATATLDNLSGNASAPFEVTGLSTSPIEYGPGVTALNVNGGTSAGGSAGVTYNVNETQSGTATTINSGTAADTVVLNVAAGTPLAGGLTYNGGAGGATLDVKLATSATLPASGVTFNGNSGATLNGLSVDGNGQNVTYTADGATAGKGTISDGTGTISFTSLTPIDMDGLGTATFAAAAGDAPVKVLNGFDFLHGGTNPAIQVVPNGAGTQFESVAFWNDTTVVVNTTANAGSGAVTVNSANNAHNDTNLTITTADPISIAGPVAVTGNVTLTATGATIAESGTGAISAALLTTTSAGGTTLNGSNNVTSFNATNSGAGAGSVIELTDGAAAALTVTGVAQTGGGLVRIINPNGIAINGGNIAAGSDAVTLTAAAGTITETSPDTITGGLLTTTSQGGTTLNDANNVTSFNATNSGAGAGSVVELTDAAAAALTITGIAQTGGGLVQIINPNGIAINGGNIAAGTDAVTLTASAGTILETSPDTITGGLLTTTSVNATILNDANNVTSFNATNTQGIESTIELTDAATGALTLTGIDQTAGGFVQIINPNGIVVSGGVSTDINVAPSNLLLTATAGTITEPGGTISSGSLTTTSSGGTTLNGVNDINLFIATNSGAGAGSVVELTDAATGAVTVASVSQTGGGLVQIVNPNGIAVNGAGGNIAAGTDAVTLTATAGTITETSPSTITGGLLTTTSLGGTTLNDANNVTSFNATNSGAGAGSVVELTDAATGALSVTGIAQTGGGLVQIVNPNGIAVNGNIAAGTDAVTLTSTAGTLAEAAVTITGGLLTSTSSGGTTLNGANNVTSFTATNAASGNIQFTAAGALIITSAGVVNSAADGNSSNGNVQIITFGGMQIQGTISAAGTVSLKEYTAEIQESLAGLISANLLITQSKTGQTLNGANTTANFLAVNDPSGGNLQLTNTAAPLTIQGIIETGGNVTVKNTGTTAVNDGILVTGTIKDTAGTVNLQETAGEIRELGGQIDASQLVTSSVEGTILNGNNAITTFNATNSTNGDIDLNNNSNALLTITGINQQNVGDVQVINFGGSAVGTGILITGAIADSSGVTVSIKEWNADIQENPAGAIDTNTLITQSKRGTVLALANAVTGFLAVNDPNGGDVRLVDNSADVYIAGITETGGNVIVNNSGAITLPSSASINTSGFVTLDVGTGNAAATTSNIAGTINSAGQVTVNGSIGSAILEIPLATIGLNGDGLIFNGGSGAPNVLDISSKAGSNVYCAEEENVSSTVSTIYHAAAAGSPYDAELAYNNNVQKVEFEDTLGGVDHVAVHVSDLDPAVSTQYWINAAAGQGSTLKVDASKTTVAQQYAIGDFPAGWTVSTLAPALATASLTWNAAPPAPLTPLPVSVQQKFIVNDLALLQYFGGTGGGCVINNTGAINAANATNALMVASLKQTNNSDVTTLIGGKGSSNELLGGAGTSQLLGRGTNDYDLDNYTVDPVTPTLNTVSPPTLKLLPLANAIVLNNFIYEFPTGLSYILQQNTAPLGSADFDTNKVIAANDTGGGLTPTEWLSATLESSKQILQQSQGSSVLALLPGCPNETPHA